MDKIIFMISIKDNDLKIIKRMMIYIIGQDLSYLRNHFNILKDYWNFYPGIYYNSVTQVDFVRWTFWHFCHSFSPISAVLTAQQCHHDKENCCAHILYFISTV